MHLLAVALGFPAVVFTVLLGVVLVYWALVVAGALSIDLLGDGVADGAVDGAADGVDAGDVGDAGDLGHHGPDHAGGALSGMLAALKLRSAPATVVISCLVLFSWVLTMLGMLGAEVLFDGALLTVAKVALLVIAPILALLPTSLAVRPLASVFTPPKAAAHADLVGKICTVRTGTVTERFGEATLEDGGAGVVVRVRVATGEQLARGEQAVIVGYDQDRQEFTVAPLAAADEVLSRRRDAK